MRNCAIKAQWSDDHVLTILELAGNNLLSCPTALRAEMTWQNNCCLERGLTKTHEHADGSDQEEAEDERPLHRDTSLLLKFTTAL